MTQSNRKYTLQTTPFGSKIVLYILLLSLFTGISCTQRKLHIAAAITPTRVASNGSTEQREASDTLPGYQRKQVVFISFAPSPYTNRHDCMRAGFGIYLLLKEHIEQFNLPIDLAYYDGSQDLDTPSGITRIMTLADIYVMGGSTWNQGPAFYVRRFFERVGTTNLLGVSATAWATAGGAHTGGEEVINSFLRSLMGMGANVFAMGQKFMVFTTDERMTPTTPGAYSRFDMWYMDQFARMIAVKTLSGDNRARAQRLSARFGVTPLYFKNSGTHPFPPPPNTLDRYERLLSLINAAADPDSEAWKSLQTLLSRPDTDRLTSHPPGLKNRKPAPAGPRPRESGDPKNLSSVSD